MSVLKMEVICLSEMLIYIPINPHGVTTQKFSIFSAVGTSNLTVLIKIS
jgi:hypothetical protein